MIRIEAGRIGVRAGPVKPLSRPDTPAPPLWPPAPGCD